MTLRLNGISGESLYGVALYLGSTLQGARWPMTESFSGQYEATPSGLAAGIYLAVFDNDGIEVARSLYAWDGSKEITNSVLSESINGIQQTIANLQIPDTPVAIATKRNTTSSIKIQC